LTDPLLGHLVDGRYEVLSRIARGGMATVYLAIDRRLDREVALKVMHPHLAEGTTGTEFIARFRREARAAARLTHPGLVGVLDQGVDGETSYLAMEYVEGTNLRHRLADGPMAVGDALRVVEAILEALAVAHRTGLVHRDIKPENVLIALDERIKVADFGLARAVTEVTATATGTVLGTVAYLAPELVARGASDARTDVYAVGILLYEMLTGAQPFTGDTPIQIAYQHVNSDIPAPSGAVAWLPMEIDELIGALAARDPSDRPADAAAALQLVRRTRAALDDDLLARRAASPAPPVPPETDDADVAPGDPDATESIVLASGDRHELHRTIALPIGSGLRSAPPAPDLDPDPATSESAHPRRRWVWLTAAIALVAVLGVGGWWFMTSGPGAYRPVPAGLVGVERAAAEAILAEADLAVTITESFHPEVALGLVISTAPGEGDAVRKDGSVELVVSKGPDLRLVPPDLLGKPVADVAAALTVAGFEVAEPVGDYDDTMAAGNVLRMSVESGASVPVGTKVSLTVSEGPAPITVASVVNTERQAAIVTLEAQGLVVEVVEDYSETVAAGLVAAQSLAPDSDAHRMDAITITVSLGMPLIAVPEIPYGAALPDAQAAIEAAGFTVDVQRASPFLHLNRVIAQSPDGGAMAPKGSAIVLTIT
jgi:serine/threonine-protein kinase